MTGNSTKGRLVEVKPRLPTVKQPVSRWRRFDELATAADELCERAAEICQLRNDLFRKEAILRRVGRAEPGDVAPIENAEAATLTDYDRELLAECREALRVLDPEDYYDEDGELLREPICKRLAVLVSSFPNGAPPDPDGYAAMLIEHVASVADLRYLALDAACRRIVEEKTFLPATAELLKILREEAVTWSGRKYSIVFIETFAKEAADQLATLKPAIDAAAAVSRAKQAKLELDRAVYHLGNVEKRVCEKQTLAGKAAQEVEKAFAELAECEQRIATATTAAAEAFAQAAAAKPKA